MPKPHGLHSLDAQARRWPLEEILEAQGQGIEDKLLPTELALGEAP